MKIQETLKKQLFHQKKEKKYLKSYKNGTL